MSRIVRMALRPDRASADAGVAIRAAAKLNLSLAVLARRSDGFHDIESLMVPVDLHDIVRVRPARTPGIHLSVRFGGQLAGPRGAALARDVPMDDSNLVVRAVRLLAAEAGIDPSLDIELVKAIPSGAGLGGGSSDAAAVLRAAATAWGIDWPAERLATIGAAIGSDVPWFFAGGPAIARGRGERVEPVPALLPLAAVIACPAVGLSTAAVYGRCTPDAGQRGMALRLAGALAAGGLASALPFMHNALEEPARRLCPDVDRLLAALACAGAVAPRLTGSGSACFALTRTVAEARGLAARVAAKGAAAGGRWPAVFVVRLVQPGRPAAVAV